MHVCEGSTVADRCRLFALSDCKDPAFYDDCKHSHDDCCDRCELLASAMDAEIDNTQAIYQMTIVKKCVS